MSNSNSRILPRVGVEHYELATRGYDVITDINVYSGVSVCVSVSALCLLIYT